MDDFKIAIIGGGPAGLSAGAQAARRKVSHVVLESGNLANTITRYQKGKHVMSVPARLPLREELALPFAPASREEILEGWQEASQRAETNLWIGPENEVVNVSGQDGAFILTLKDGRKLSCGKVIVAIGVEGNPRRFDVAGDTLPFVSHQLDDPAAHVDLKIAVVGVGDSGIENAIALAEQNEVTLVNRSDEFSRAQEANRSLIEAAIRAGHIVHQANSRVQRIEPGALVLDTDHGELRLPVDLVFCRLGAIPPRQFLEAMQIEFRSDDPTTLPEVSETYETNVPGIYAIGSLVGYPLIKQALNQGFEVVEYALGHHVIPADEGILAEKFDGLPGTVSEIIESIRTSLPLFRGLTPIQLREFLVDSELCHPVPGEVILNRNEFSNEFYSILSGSVEIVVPLTAEGPQSDKGATAAPTDRRFRQTAGRFFGEMSLISGGRRVADVIAGSDCILIKTPRLAMNRLVRSVPAVKRVIDETFILRAVQRALPSEVGSEGLEELVRHAEILEFQPGETIFEEDDESDGLHLIRRGSVTVSRKSTGGELILAYVQTGHLVGESSILLPSGLRNASVRAAVFTETIRLPVDAIRTLLDENPRVKTYLRSLESSRLVQNVARTADQRGGQLADFLIGEGAGDATELLLINEALCIECDNCEKACAGTHGGVTLLDRQAGPTFASVHIPTSCRHCENPRCMSDCPPDTVRRHSNGEVYIVDGCIGCGNCVKNCPYDVIQLATVDPAPKRNLLADLLWGRKKASTNRPDSDPARKAVKCDLCKDVPGVAGHPERTACVASCPTGAMIRIAPKDYLEKVLPE